MCWPQTECRVGATVTSYRFADGRGLSAEVDFTTSRLTDDLDVFSRPVTYVTVRVSGAKEWSVRVSITGAWATNDDKAEMVWTTNTVAGVRDISVGRADAVPFLIRGDHKRANWGRVHLVGPIVDGATTRFLLAYDNKKSVRFFGEDLAQFGYDPGNQLCTDDCAGRRIVKAMKAQIVEIIRSVPYEGLRSGVGFDKIRGTRRGMGSMKSKFIGRDAEMSQLVELWGKRTSSLVVCRGRRRIGKSTLIEEFAARSDCRFIEISGLPPDSKMTNQRQLDSFCERLSMQIGCPRVKADSWQGAFALLAKAVGRRTKTVVLLDEISWMGKYDPAFPGELKNLWDLSLARRDNLVFFVCGSVSAWIQRNILNNTGFVGRISLEFVLDEMRLDDSVGFWGRMSKHLSCGEFFDVLSVTGAVPRYLEEINPRLSADENVRRMCFTSGGYLFRDFDRIFNDVFGESHAIKREIMLSLRSGPKTVSEIAQIVERAKNGHVSEHLVELEKAGFVASDAGVNPETGGKALALRYRIKDNYSRFYLRYVEPHREAIQKGVYAAPPLAELPEWDTVMGLQFENLMLNHLSEFYERLGLDRARVLSIAPYRRAASVRNGPGVQIDLLIQTPKTYFVVEVKRKRRIGVEIEKEVEEKVSRLRVRKGVSVRTALVYQGELDPQVKEDGYFSVLIDAETLLRHLRVPQV